MARSNKDQIPTDQIRVVRRDFNDPNVKHPLNLDWTAKDKMRDVEWGADGIGIEYEDVPAWDGDPFANVWIVLWQGGEWVCRHYGQIRRSDENRIGTGPTGKAIYQAFVPHPGNHPIITPEAGYRYGVFIAGTEVGRRAAIRTYRRPEVQDPPPPPPSTGDRGADWPFNGGRAPIVVMTPTGEMGGGVWRDWMDRYEDIVGVPGWDGTHTPLQGVWRQEVGDLAERNGSDRVTALWLVDQDQDVLSAKSMAAFVVSQLRDTPGWKVVGPTYDVQERWSVDDVNEWVRFCRELDAPRFLWGARALPQFTYAGDFAAHEDHVPEIGGMDGILLEEIARSGGRPCWNTERFRVRNGGEGKDWVEGDFAAGIRLLRERNVGAIFGIQDARGSVSDYGSGPPRNPAAIREALGSTQPTTGTDEMYHLDDHRNYRIKISDSSTHGPNEPDEVFVWPDGARQADGEVSLSNPRMAIIAVNYMLLRDRPQWEEYTVVVSINGKEIDMVVDESNEDSAQRASVLHVLGEQIEVPANARMKVSAIHNNLSNRAHIEAKLRCKALGD